MVIDDFMFYVARKWYRLYWLIMVLCSGAVVAGFIAQYIAPSLIPDPHRYGIDTLGAILAIGTLLYLVGPYWFFARRALALSTLVGTMANSLVLLYCLSATDPGTATIPFVALWLFTTGLNGMYGFPILLGSALITNVALLAGSDFDLSRFSLYSWVLAGGSLAMVGLGYFFWRNRFANKQDQQVSQLSGMLRTNQQQSGILIRSIADGVIGMTTEGKITLINPAAAALTEWPVDEAVGIDVRLVMTLATPGGEPLSAEDNPFAAVLRGQRPPSLTLQLTGRAGKRSIVSLIISPIMSADNTTPSGAVAVIRDISEEHAADKQRDEFISTASHEMRTPVAAIEGYLALALSEKVSTIDQRARSYLEKAHSSTQHLGKLFQDLLTSSKAEDGRLTNHPVVVEMGAFMQQLSDDLKFAAEKKGLFSEFLIGASDDAVDATRETGDDHIIKPLYYVHVDPDRIREVITNLFDNACKYTDQGKITLGLTGNNDVVQVYVRDTGPGIPAADIPHLFQKFYRVDNSATRTIGGTGLGLFICRKIVELYHGRIWAESTEGKGSTFLINIPRLSNSRVAELQDTTPANSNSGPPAPPSRPSTGTSATT